MGHPKNLLARQRLAHPAENLANGTDKKYWGPFEQGFKAAKDALRRKSCASFFGDHGLATMEGTEYRFYDLGNAQTGDRTIDDNTVEINQNGPYMNYHPTPDQEGPFGAKWLTQARFQSFILLHELGHQLSSITDFQPDANNRDLNAAQSRQVINACF
jgi:hypothetical protein